MENISVEYPKYVKGVHYKSKLPICIEIKEGKISGVDFIESRDDELPLLAPGLVDLQINGYGGVDFNSILFTEEDVLKAVRLLSKQGVTNFLPTLITNDKDAIKKAIQIIKQACGRYKEVDDALIGIHLEGPFLSKEDGPRGAHSSNFIQAPDWNLFQEWQRVAEGKIKIITLSPEWSESENFIEKCAASGVVVSIGHTAASSQQIVNAVAAGAKLSTHLGNGAHLMLPRHPNYIWEQLAQEQLWTTVIADGFHLPDSFLKVAFKMKPDKSILISDCTQFAGLIPGIYQSHIGGTVCLNEEGRLCMADEPALLAGSAQSLLWCVKQMIKKGLLDFERAWDNASLKPLELLGSSSNNAAFQSGSSADIVLMEMKKQNIEIRQTIIGGKLIM